MTDKDEERLARIHNEKVKASYDFVKSFGNSVLNAGLFNSSIALLLLKWISGDAPLNFNLVFLIIFYFSFSVIIYILFYRKAMEILERIK